MVRASLPDDHGSHCRRRTRTSSQTYATDSSSNDDRFTSGESLLTTLASNASAPHGTLSSTHLRLFDCPLIHAAFACRRCAGRARLQALDRSRRSCRRSSACSRRVLARRDQARSAAAVRAATPRATRRAMRAGAAAAAAVAPARYPESGGLTSLRTTLPRQQRHGPRSRGLSELRWRLRVMMCVLHALSRASLVRAKRRSHGSSLGRWNLSVGRHKYRARPAQRSCLQALLAQHFQIVLPVMLCIRRGCAGLVTIPAVPVCEQRRG
jgi:hypothetical protein